MKKCRNCEAIIRDEDKYCRNCGILISNGLYELFCNVFAVFIFVVIILFCVLFVASYIVE